MPWTLSHPAAVIPLRKYCPRRLDFPALVMGSMTPDLGYYLNRFDLSDYAHTLPGTFFACVPSGLILLLALYVFSRPVCYVLPSPHRELLLPRCPAIPKGLRRWLIIFLSLLLGAVTHNFWDSFTHEDGWFVLRIAFLRKIAFYLGATPIHVFLLLQESSTLIGIIILGVIYYRWLRKRTPTLRLDSESDKWRYFLWLTVLSISFVISLPAAISYAATASKHGVLFLRSVLFRGAIYGPWIGFPLILLCALVAFRRRQSRKDMQAFSSPQG